MCVISVCRCDSCVLHLSLSLSPDPSLSPKNVSTVLDIMEDDLWWDFSHYVNIPDSERRNIYSQYSSDNQQKQAFIIHLISTHPALSWRLLANALYKMGPLSPLLYAAGGGVSCHRALDRLQQLFPTGNTYCKHHQYAPAPREGFPGGVGGTTDVLPHPA